jgi:hypothetical protein
MKEAGRAIPGAIQQTCKEFGSLKVRRDRFVGLGPLFRLVEKRASFYKYVPVQGVAQIVVSGHPGK